VDLVRCSERVVSGNLAALRSLPSLCTLHLPASCAESAEDAEAVYGMTTLTQLTFRATTNPNEWMLDLSRLTTLTILDLQSCPVNDELVRSVSNLVGLTFLDLSVCDSHTGEGLGSSLTALTKLNLGCCHNITAQGMRAVSRLPALTHLNLNSDGQNDVGLQNEDGLCEVRHLTRLTDLNIRNNHHVTDAVMHAVSGLPALTSLDISECRNITSEALCEVRNLTGLTELFLGFNFHLTMEVFRAVSTLTALVHLDLPRCFSHLYVDKLRTLSRLTALESLNLTKASLNDDKLLALSGITALTSLDIHGCRDVTAAAKQALRDALPRLTLHDGL